MISLLIQFGSHYRTNDQNQDHLEYPFLDTTSQKVTNAILNGETRRETRLMWWTFLCGSHPSIGAESSIYIHFVKDPLFERTIMFEIFAFLAESSNAGRRRNATLGRRLVKLNALAAASDAADGAEIYVDATADGTTDMASLTAAAAAAAAAAAFAAGGGGSEEVGTDGGVGTEPAEAENDAS